MDLVRYYDDYWRRVGDTCDTVRLQLILGYVDAGADALEVDCGAGVFAGMLLAKGVRVQATEMSPVAAEMARRKGVPVTLVDLDAETLPFPDGSFSIVVSNSAIEHRFFHEKQLEECIRVLRPGGKLVLSLPNIAHWRCRLWLLAGRFPYLRNTPTDVSHLRFFTLAEAKALCRQRGVEPVATDGNASLWVRGFYPGIFRRRPVSDLYTWLAHRWPSMFARDFLIVGRKALAQEKTA